MAGHVLVRPESDYPERYRPGSELTTDDGQVLTVERSQAREGSLLVRFASVTDRTAAEALSGRFLYVETGERRPLDEDEFWPDEVIGMVVRSPNATDLGVVDDVVEGAAQYRLVVRGPDGSFEVPFVLALVPEVDRVNRVVTVADLPGLRPGT